ncbi:MAG: alkaline phosphatase family protein [Pseudoflavonifractor sp.]
MPNSQGKKLVVISVDAMVEEDLPLLRQLPNLGGVLAEASVVHKNLSTYPTLTHGVHASIYTGCYPIHHGIPGNEHFVPGNLRSPWYEHYRDLRLPGLPELAQRQGLRSACVFWPVTIGAPDTWVLHRSSIHDPADDEAAVVRSRSTPGLVDALWGVLGDTFTGGGADHYMQADTRSCRAAAELIRREQPDVLYMHLLGIDHARHVGGVFGPHISAAYQALDAVLSPVFRALRETNLYDRTILALTADHGQIDIDRVVALNRFFRDCGLLRCDQEGNLTDWTVYGHAQAMSCQIYVRDHSPELCRRVQRLLQENRQKLGIGEIMPLALVQQRYHISGEPDFVVDTDGHSSFTSKFAVPLYAKIDDCDYRYSHATHGYLPEKGPQPTFFVRNPFTARRVEIAGARVIDQMPTLAAMMGLSAPDCDGAAIRALLG